MATKQQIPVVAARLTEFQEGLESLPTEDAQWVIMNGKEAVALFVSAVVNRAKTVVQTVATLLSAVVSTFAVSATTEKFVAKDKFKVDVSKKAKVKISYLGDNFKEWFLGKEEDPFAGSTVSGRNLEKSSVDGSILVELGGKEAAKTTLMELYTAMAAQPNGESGDLLNNGWANIFYIEDINGTLRAVFVVWGVDGWYVSASSVENPREWDAGSRVFSRNSSESQTV
ncbi:MAG: hypothetical protein WC905_04600 [Patescibacteria group bacterium]|jgi:hypothetical protein